MKYIKCLQDSIRIIRTTGLVWIFGLLSAIDAFETPLAHLVEQNPFFICIYAPLALVLLAVSFIINGALVFCVYQASMHIKASFAEAWLQGKSRVFRLVGQSLIILPILWILSYITKLVLLRAPESSLVWVVTLIAQSLTWGLTTFGVCAIMISGLNPGAAAWTGFLITVNNFLSVLIFTTGLLLARLFSIYSLALILAYGFGLHFPVPLGLDFPSYLGLLNMPVFTIVNLALSIVLGTFASVVLSVRYLQHIQEIHYPTLARHDEAAYRLTSVSRGEKESG